MFSIIIPTYNERENIVLLLPAISKEAKKAKEKFEIIVVDDNSPDGTAHEAKKLIGKLPLQVIVRKAKLGLASAVFSGARRAKGDMIIVMDADFSHPPEEIPVLARALKNCDLVIASREKVEKWAFHRKLISKGAELLSRLVIHHSVSDPMSGFFGIRKSILLDTKLHVKGYKILMNILAKNKQLKIKEIPYTFHNRLKGHTKLGNMEIGRYVLDLIKLMPER